LTSKAFFSAAGCSSGTGSNNWDVGTSNAPTAACQGLVSPKGVLKFAQGNSAFITFELPTDWSGTSLDIRLAFTTTDTNAGDMTAWDFQTGCNKTDGSMNDDPVLNAVQTLQYPITSGAASGGQYAVVLAGLNPTGCAPGSNMVIKITRNHSGVDTNIDTAVAAKWAELTLSRIVTAASR